MLKFNQNHKSIKGSLKKNQAKFNTNQIITIAGLTIVSLFLFSGCAKNVECNIEEPHAHNYVSDTSFDRYVVSEREYIGEWFRTDDFVVIDEEAEKLIDFENKRDLFKIEENQQTIDNIISMQEDYMEYRYSYVYLVRYPITTKVGNVRITTYHYARHTGYHWTSDPNHENLTGETRMVHHVYYGYKIEKNERGKYILVKSEPVDNLNDLPEGYDYIKEDFVVKVDANNREIVLDYENGAPETHRLPDEQIAEYEEQLAEENGMSR